MICDKDSLIVLSGGLDSTTLLHEYKERTALAVTFDYGSNHNGREIACARRQCAALGIEHIVIPLSFMGEYFKSSLLSGADAIPDGGRIAVPNDTTNEGRALLLLEAQGIIKLKDSTKLDSTPNDIAENPKNLEFVELAAENIPSNLDEVDVAAINSNYALGAGLNPVEDALVLENSEDNPYVNILAVKEGNENSEVIQALVKALQSDTVRDYILNTYGGAVLKHSDQAPPPYATRKNTNVEGKVAIARLLAGMLQNGDTLMVDESSTALFAVRAVRHLKELTLITNSLNILQEVSSQDSWHIISTGGRLKPDIMALVGPKALSTIQGYHVGYAVLSARGVNTQLGIADSSDEVVEVKRAMMAAADRTVLLADHRKFDRAGFVSLGRLEEIDQIITDRPPPEEWKKRLEDSKVQLLCRSEQAQA